MLRRTAVAAVVLSLVAPALATIFGSVRGIIHDPQHRPVQGAMVMLKAKSSDWAKSANTDANGEFVFNAVPLGDYSVSVASPGFAQAVQNVVVISSTEPVVHFQLRLEGAKETLEVSGVPEIAPTDSATPITLVNRLQIERTPGASRSNSMAMITNFVPGAYVTHDQLHIRGGHQTSWLVDGVPVPNTNIASNLGPQFDPKDIDYMEVNRGSYSAEFGTGHTGSLTSFRALALHETIKPSWFSVPATSIKRTINSASGVTQNVLPTMPVSMGTEAI